MVEAEKSASHQAAPTETDGRRARSTRSREAIKKALLDLIDEGIREPTAQLVSDKAGVGIRSVFRHFEDMGTLFHSLHEDLKDRDRHIVEATKLSGPLEERLDSLLESRETIYIKNRNVILSTLGLMWKHHSLKETYQDLNNILRRQFLNCLYEFKAMPDADRELGEMLLSFEAWNRLTRHQNMTPEEARVITRASILRLLEG